MTRAPCAATCLLLSLPLAAAAETAGLPLQEGYYTEAGETCAGGNDATLLYLHEGGFNNRYGMCSFDAVTPESAADYSYAVTCVDSEQGFETLNEGRIEIRDSAGFHIFDGVMDLEYSFCPPSDLPPPWGTP